MGRYPVEGFDSGSRSAGRPGGRTAPFDLGRPVAPWVVFGPRDAAAFAEQSEAFRARGGRVHHLRAEDLREMGSPLVEEPYDVVAAVDGAFATAALDLAAWRPVTWARGLDGPGLTS
ncbi:hypothetical protein AB0953_14385 [Streptomyces sp. NPDC046866]|uniref:hypothetical protein n=1 Tax=Streptomyces sp. NPDC046866 TaxID=3154921 RepID=UPI003455B6EA